MFDLVLRGGTVVTPDGCIEADVGITGDTIRAVGPASFNVPP